MTEQEFQEAFDEMLPEPWENCLEELERFIFGEGNLANRYTPHELVAALLYLERSQAWKLQRPGRECEWLHSRDFGSVIQEASVISRNGKAEK
jgi:hypothetical protein